MLLRRLLNEAIPQDILKRLGGRYGGEPEAAIADPGNKEPALSAKKETTEMIRLQDLLPSLDEAGKPVGAPQEKLMNALETRPKLAWIELSDIARHPDFSGIHFRNLMTAAKALSKKGLIEYDGISKVRTVPSVNEASAPRDRSGREVKPIDTYKGWKIYTLPDYDTPYYYPEQRYVKGKGKMGGSSEHRRSIRQIYRMIDKWLKLMEKERLDEFTGKDRGKNVVSSAASRTDSAANKRMSPTPVPEAQESTFQCMDCGKKLRKPRDTCPRCGSGDIDIAN